MGKQRPRFTLFVSRDDRALAVSRRVWGNVSRLGAIDPEQSPYKEELAANGITVVDLTKIKQATICITPSLRSRRKSYD